MALLLAGLTAIAAAEPPTPAAGRQQILEAYRTEMTSLDDFHKDNFTLMVHAYNPFMARGFTEQLKEKGTYDPKRDINLMKEPERLREKGMVSASIITAEQLPTFGRLLFILAFEPEDILATAPEDGYFIYKKKEILEHPPGPTFTPREMVAKTKPEEYNEVVLRSEHLKLQGLGVKLMIRHDGSIDTPAEADELRALAEEKGLPFVELSEACILEDKPVEVFSKDGVITSVALQHNGVGYFMNRYMQQRYFHPNKMDWEDISEPEYQKIRLIFRAALEDREGGLDFLHVLDEKMENRFRENGGTGLNSIQPSL